MKQSTPIKVTTPVDAVSRCYSLFSKPVNTLIGSTVEVTDKTFPLHGRVGTVQSLRISETGVYVSLQFFDDSEIHEVPLICVTSVSADFSSPSISLYRRLSTTH